jgi:hypothetical protein
MTTTAIQYAIARFSPGNDASTSRWRSRVAPGDYCGELTRLIKQAGV